MAGGWIEWCGGTMPVSGSVCVEVEYRAPANPAKGIRIEWDVCADKLNWTHDGEDDDIVRYRIVTP